MNCLDKFFSDTKYAVSWGIMGFFIVCVLLSIFLIVTTINILDKPTDFSSTISVTGHGEVVAIPDITTFSYSVTETADDVATAQDRSAEKINETIAYLKQNGVEENDIKTVSYNVYPQYEFVTQELSVDGIRREPASRTLVGYTVDQRVSVKIRETEKAGELLSGIGNIGITNVSGLSFIIDDQENLQNEARKKAIKNAKEKAKNLAKDLGASLGKVVSFAENNGQLYGHGYRTLEATTDAAFAPNLPLGENTVSITVDLFYEIK